MKHYLVCYDITDDDARLEAAKILGEYGDRVQLSVFEIVIRSENELERLQERLREALREETDIHFYPLCAECRSGALDLAGNRIARSPAAIIL